MKARIKSDILEEGFFELHRRCSHAGVYTEDMCKVTLAQEIDIRLKKWRGDRFEEVGISDHESSEDESDHEMGRFAHGEIETILIDSTKDDKLVGDARKERIGEIVQAIERGAIPKGASQVSLSKDSHNGPTTLTQVGEGKPKKSDPPSKSGNRSDDLGFDEMPSGKFLKRVRKRDEVSPVRSPISMDYDSDLPNQGSSAAVPQVPSTPQNNKHRQAREHAMYDDGNHESSEPTSSLDQFVSSYIDTNEKKEKDDRSASRSHGSPLSGEDPDVGARFGKINNVITTAIAESLDHGIFHVCKSQHCSNKCVTTVCRSWNSPRKYCNSCRSYGDEKWSTCSISECGKQFPSIRLKGKKDSWRTRCKSCHKGGPGLIWALICEL